MGWLLLAPRISSWRTSHLGREPQGRAGVAPALWERTGDVQGFSATSQQGLGNNR